MSVSSASAPAAHLLGDVAVAFLRNHPPFDTMEDDALAWIAPRLSMGYYPKETRILGPGGGEPDFLYIVQRGLVHVAPAAALRDAPGEVVPLRAGETFSVGALMEKRPVTATYTAAGDTFCYQIARADAVALLERSPRFREYGTRYLATLLKESRRLLGMHHSSAAAEQQALGRSLRSLARRAPVACAIDTPLAAALNAMHEHDVGSILVADDSGKLVGIFTRHDVLDRVALTGCDLSVPIERVMTRDPYTLGPDDNAFEAALLVARHGVRHVPIVEGGRAVGIVTERDLFALQRASVRGVVRAIREADAIGKLTAAARDIRALARNLFEHGVAPEQLTHLISSLDDALTARILELEQARHDIAGIRWCWLAFGSEGRYEQTIATDQDNGLVFVEAPGASAEAVRARLLPFAKAVNETLDACGFPLCTGNIMAGNPAWCLSEAEWTAQFSRWIENTDPQALLGAAIFFDLRGLHGESALVESIRASLARTISRHPRFLMQLAQQALQTRPPLGFVSDFVTRDVEHAPGTIDLKGSGARLFTDAARVMSLAAGTPATNSAQRLREAGPKLGMSEREIESATDAFFFIQGLRVRSQLGTGAEAVPNRVDPATLNEVDRRLLKESLIQARKLQARLALDYGL